MKKAPKKPKDRIKRNGNGNKGTPNLVPNLEGRPKGAKTHNWAPVEERYVQGYLVPSEATGAMIRYFPTVAELSTEFAMPLKTVRWRCTKSDWVAKREAWIEADRKRRDEAMLKELTESELRLRRKSLKAAEKIIDRIGGDGATPAMVDSADPEELATLSGALRRSQEVANVAIGIPKDGVKAPSTDDPGKDGQGVPVVTVWSQMRESRQQIIVGVQITNQ